MELRGGCGGVHKIRKKLQMNIIYIYFPANFFP